MYKIKIDNIKLIALVLLICVLISFFIINYNKETFNNSRAKNYNYNKDEAHVLGKKMLGQTYTLSKPDFDLSQIKCEKCGEQ
jgi:hypothetical protein